MNNISIVIPIFNEEASLRYRLQRLDCLLKQNDNVELIFVDGGSSDHTLNCLSSHYRDTWRVKVLSSEMGRARQMNAGANASSFDHLLFLHIDTELPCDFSNEVNRALMAKGWGRFDVRLDDDAWVYKMISFFINWRSRLTSVATGDQTLFITRSMFERVGCFPDQLLMEDVEITKRLKVIGKPYCSKSRVITSARKWQQGGVVRTIFLMWSLRYAYYKGASPSELYKRYYQNH